MPLPVRAIGSINWNFRSSWQNCLKEGGKKVYWDSDCILDYGCEKYYNNFQESIKGGYPNE